MMLRRYTNLYSLLVHFAHGDNNNILDNSGKWYEIIRNEKSQEEKGRIDTEIRNREDRQWEYKEESWMP